MIGIHLLVYSNFLYADLTEKQFQYDDNYLPRDRSYSSAQYKDIYRCHDVINPGGYILAYEYVVGAGSRIGNFYLDISYRRNMLNGKIDNLAEMKDAVQFKYTEESTKISGLTKLGKSLVTVSVFAGYTPGLELSFQRQFGNFLCKGLASYLEDQANISYDVKNDDGAIPFNWSKQTFEGNISTDKTKSGIRYTFWLPGAGIDQFDNRLYLQDMLIQNTFELTKTIQTSLSARYREFSGKLIYSEGIYSKIDNLQMMDFHFSIKKQSTHSVFTFGSDYYQTWSGSDSYFDIWPFTAWDMFLASRTRLKQLNIDCLVPEVCYEYSNLIRIGNVEISYRLGSEYHHIFHQEEIEIKNRVVVLYPFLFGYDTYHYQVKNLDGYFVIPLKSDIYAGHFTITAKVTQMIPIHWKTAMQTPSSHEPSAANKKSEWGGTFYGLTISFPY